MVASRAENWNFLARTAVGGRPVGQTIRRSGARLKRARHDLLPNANAIPWLLLKATWDGQAGAFAGATHIQRVATTGGLAPTAAGTKGQIASMPYRAEYYFYRAP